MRHRALQDSRFGEGAAGCGLCPVDIGVLVLEGVLLASAATTRTAAPPAAGSTAATREGGVWALPIEQLRLALQALIVRYEGTVAAPPPEDARGSSRSSGGGRPRGGRQWGGVGTSGGAGRRARGFRARRTDSAPALSSFSGVLRELLVTMELQNGIRYGAQLQTAKVFVVALEQLQQQLGLFEGGGRTSAAAPRVARLTKRERAALDSLVKEGLVGPGAVDPSPQRSTVALAAVITLLLA